MALSPPTGLFAVRAARDSGRGGVRPCKTLHHAVASEPQPVRLLDEGASICTRTGPDEIVVDYTSARRMCALAKGIAKGVAKHYRESIAITEGSACSRGTPSVGSRFPCAVEAPLAAGGTRRHTERAAAGATPVDMAAAIPG